MDRGVIQTAYRNGTFLILVLGIKLDWKVVLEILLWFLFKIELAKDENMSKQIPTLAFNPNKGWKGQKKPCHLYWLNTQKSDKDQKADSSYA